LATLSREIDLPTADKVDHTSLKCGLVTDVSIDKRNHRQVL
jgi:hypothetical protein